MVQDFELGIPAPCKTSEESELPQPGPHGGEIPEQRDSFAGQQEMTSTLQLLLLHLSACLGAAARYFPETFPGIRYLCHFLGNYHGDHSFLLKYSQENAAKPFQAMFTTPEYEQAIPCSLCWISGPYGQRALKIP